MKIGGFQRFSLLDYPGQLAAIIFTQGCNFRCPYCHNPELVDPKRFSPVWDNKMALNFLARRKGKLGAVVITGGEPTCQPDLVSFTKKIKRMGYLVKIDTNGSDPDMIGELAGKKLVDYWAMDLKAPLDLYPVVTNAKLDTQKIIRSMDILRSSGREYEFRTTFFDLLFSWEDIARVQSLLLPGDKFYLQECRYDNTLDDLSGGKTGGEQEEPEHHRLEDDPACKTLLQWGFEHRVKVHIRSL